MALALESVDLKLARAEEHLNSLEHEIGDYLRQEPYEIVREAKYDYAACVLRLTRQPPPRLTVIAGDCLYDARSALDHLAQALHVANGGSINDKRVCFPIFCSEVDFKNRPSGCRAIETMRADVRDFIVRQQPYFGRNHADAIKHPLWLLHEFNNTDKHRTLNITSASTVSMSASLFSQGQPGSASVRHISGGTFHDGDEIAAFNLTLDEAIRKNVHVKPELTTFVSFKEAGLGDTRIEEFLRTLLAGIRHKIIEPLVTIAGQ